MVISFRPVQALTDDADSIAFHRRPDTGETKKNHLVSCLAHGLCSVPCLLSKKAKLPIFCIIAGEMSLPFCGIQRFGLLALVVLLAKARVLPVRMRIHDLSVKHGEKYLC